MLNSCEDAIETLAGLKEVESTDSPILFQIENSDKNLVYSLARQTFKGIGFTDRQYDLAKQKVLYYKSQFDQYNIDLENINTTRLPLRQIDRSRWVKLVDDQGPNKVYESDKAPFIAIRFIFQKKLISNIEAIKRSLGEGDYDKENKIHYFPFNEKSVFEILSNFNESNNFEIDTEIKEYYEKILKMNENKKNFVTSLRGFNLNNISNKAFDYAISTIGEPSQENLIHYYDQRDVIGIADFDDNELHNSFRQVTPLTAKIVQRTKKRVLVNSNKYTLEQLAESILELNRFPLLVVLDEKHAFDELTTFYKLFANIIPNDKISVMFRKENVGEGIHFNQFIQQKQLNNLVDKNTKIVYISNNKVPKPLLQADWHPSAAFTSSANRLSTKVGPYLESFDLVLHYDDDASPFLRGYVYKA